MNSKMDLLPLFFKVDSKEFPFEYSDKSQSTDYMDFYRLGIDVICG